MAKSAKKLDRDDARDATRRIEQMKHDLRLNDKIAEQAALLRGLFHRESYDPDATRRNIETLVNEKVVSGLVIGPRPTKRQQKS